ncbi:hypothetical protein [Chrysiogenes arsenatis]|uniref:hypothetical protein n=1 Tax=Chrysiogenes arsenatis TaxID=309797 RepID=UPI0004258EFB|nr:hypothetical protein [Chrysiogenes arsenatis]
MLRLLLVSALALALSGCYTAKLLNLGVSSYCSIVEPTERDVIRAAINKELDPHTVRIECAMVQ